MAEERDEVMRGISLEQTQLIGLHWFHDEIYEEMMGSCDRINALMQMMQKNNLQPQQKQARRVHQNVVVEAELESNKDDEADKKGRPKRQNNHPLTGN